MEKISIKEVRHAINYVDRSGNINDMTDEELLKCDLTRDLNMGNIRIYNVVTELQRVHGFCLPVEMFRTMPDNTVGSLMNAVNQHLRYDN